MKSRSLMTVFGVALVAWAASVLPAQAQVDMFFTNDQSVSGYADSNIWITLSTNATTDITFGNGSAALLSPGSGSSYNYAQSINLTNIEANGGLLVNNDVSQEVFVSYGSALNVTNYTTGTAITPSSTNDANYQTKYQNFELSYTNGIYADLTAINYFSAELSLSLIAGTNSTGAVQKTVGFNPGVSANDVYQQLAAAAGPNATNSGNPVPTVQLSTNGSLLRVAGPAAFTSTNYGTWPSYNQYLGNVATNSSLSPLVLQSAGTQYQTGPGGTSNPYSVASITYNMTNGVSNTVNGYGMTANGNITVVIINYATNNISPTIPVAVSTATNVFSNAIANVNPSNNGSTITNIASLLIYTATANPNPTNTYMSGAGWTAFTNYFYVTNTAFNSYSFGSNTATWVTNSIAPVITSQMFGDIATAFTYGLVGSTNIVTIGALTTNIGALPTDLMWQITNLPFGFGAAQTNTNYYSAYAGIIANSSSNSVYSAPYSDRFTASPLIYASNGESVLVTIGGTIGAVPEPSAYLLFGLGVLAVVVAYRRKFER
jgi:hypothetical protein